MLKTLGRREAWFSVMIYLVNALLMTGAVRLLLELARLITSRLLDSAHARL